MLPEIEERVLSMKRGEKEIIKASFPASHPVPFLRGRKRLIEISLFDCKANSHPPVVEDDLNILPKSGRYVAA